MIVCIHCQYPSVTGCGADIVQQLIPRDKKETESRFGLQHKILTAVDAVVRQILSDIRKNTEVQKKIQIQIKNSNSGCMHLYVSLTLTRHEKEIQIHIDSNWSLLRSKALKYYLDIYTDTNTDTSSDENTEK